MRWSWVILLLLVVPLFVDAACLIPNAYSTLAETTFVPWIVTSSGTTHGSGVANLGDINNDGVDDIGFGFNENQNVSNGWGGVYVFFGTGSGFLNETLNVSDADITIVSEDGSASFSRPRGLGDVNGDGIDDFLATAWLDDEGGANAGEVAIFFGRDSWPSFVNASNANASFIGENAGDFFGHYAKKIGDVNGDGLQDFLMAAQFYSVGGALGKVYIKFGNTTGWALNVDANQIPVSFIAPNTSADPIGDGSAGLGDINGDGFLDIAIGAADASDPIATNGMMYIVFGPSSQWGNMTNLSTANVTIRGSATNNIFGHVAELGDVNGDGVNDFAVSASSDDEFASGTGQIFIFFGNSTWQSNMNDSDANASFYGEIASARVGTSGLNHGVAAGDINGDGLNDTVFGAIMPGSVGKVFIKYGNTTGWSLGVNSSTLPVQIDGQGDETVGSYLDVGDFNNDSFVDVLLSGEGWDLPGSDFTSDDSGQVYIFYGGPNNDTEFDTVVDCVDNLLGNRTFPTTSGVTDLNITVGGVQENGTFNDTQELLFYDGVDLMINVSHNFSLTKLVLSRLTITKSSVGMAVSFDNQLGANVTKTLFVPDNGYATLCVKNEEATDPTNVTEDCSGSNETDFTSCIGGSATINNITCTDLGDTFRIENLTFSGVRGTVPVPATTSSGGGGGGGGKAPPSALHKSPSRTYTYFNGPISSVTVNPAASSDAPELLMTTLGPNANVPAGLKLVFAYFDISTKGGGYHLLNASIDFYVNSTWAQFYNLTPDDIVLKRYTDEWVDLPTDFLRETNNNLHYRATTPGFSFFAIGVRVVEVEVEAERIVEEKIEEPVNETEEPPEPTGQVVKEQPAPVPEEGFRVHWWVWAIVGVLVLVGLMVGYWFWGEQE